MESYLLPIFYTCIGLAIFGGVLFCCLSKKADARKEREKKEKEAEEKESAKAFCEAKMCEEEAQYELDR